MLIVLCTKENVVTDKVIDLDKELRPDIFEQQFKERCTIEKMWYITSSAEEMFKDLWILYRNMLTKQTNNILQ